MRTLTINIEINDIESETFKICNLNELNLNMTMFFENYNITDIGIQSKIKRRVLATYNRLSKESNINNIKKTTLESTSNAISKNGLKKQDDKSASHNNLVKKTTLNGSSYNPRTSIFKNSLFGRMKNNFLEKTKANVLKQKKEIKNSFAKVEKNQDPFYLSNPSNLNIIYRPFDENAVSYLKSQTLFDSSKSHFQDNRDLNCPRNDFSSNLFKKSGEKHLINSDNIQDVYRNHYKNTCIDFSKSNMIPEFSPNPQIQHLKTDHSFTKSFKEESKTYTQKTTKKPVKESKMERSHTQFLDVKHNNSDHVNYLRKSSDRPLTLLARTFKIEQEALQSHADFGNQKPINADRIIFNLLDGLKIGIISQKNLSISNLSVSTLKLLQPLISKIYTDDENKCYNFDDFVLLLIKYKIDFINEL